MKMLPLLVACTGLFCGPASGAVFSHYSFDSEYGDDSGNGRDGTLTDVRAGFIFDTIGEADRGPEPSAGRAVATRPGNSS